MKISNLTISILSYEINLNLFDIIRNLYRIKIVYATFVFCVFAIVTSNSQTSLCALYGSIPGNAIYFNSKTINSPETYTDKYIVVNGDLTINHILATFTRCTFNISSGSQIIVNSNKRLQLSGCLLFSCGDTPWNGIYINSNGLLICQNESTNQSKIENASNGIQLEKNSKLTLSSTVFNRNSVGIRLLGTPTIFKFADNIFLGHSSITEPIGVRIDVGTFDIMDIATGINQFRTLKYGILAYGRTILVQNCQFALCDYGIYNTNCKANINFVKGFGKASSTATFSNNHYYNLYFTGDSEIAIKECISLVDNRWTKFNGIPNIFISKNNSGSILIYENSFTNNLYSSTVGQQLLTYYFDVAISNSTVNNGCEISNNLFQATNHNEFTPHKLIQLHISSSLFTQVAIIQHNTFNFNGIYCQTVGLVNNESGIVNFDGCDNCTPARQVVFNTCRNIYLNQDTFNKAHCDATSVLIYETTNITCENNMFFESDRIPFCHNTGIKIYSSQAEICSNVFDNNYIGIDAGYINSIPLTVISSNVFDNNYVGVHYFVDAMVGPQVHKGNKWINSFESGYRLIHDYITFYNLAPLNRYIIDENDYGGSNYWPITFNPGNFVFDDGIDTLTSCLPINTDTSLIHATKDLPYGYKWENFYNIIGSIEQGFTFINSAYETLYDSLNETNLYDLMRIRYDIYNFNVNLQDFQDSLDDTQTAIETLIDVINYAKISIIEDSIETGLILDSLYTLLDSLFLAKSDIEDNFLNSREDILEDIREANSSIESEVPIEVNRVLLNNILIKILKGDTLTQEDSSNLQNITLTCILDEGNNSMIAKSLLMAYYHLEFDDDHQVCEAEELLSTIEESLEHTYFNKLFNINQRIDLNADLTILNLYNLYGQKIKENVKYFDLKNAYLIPGLYFISIQKENRFFKTVKIWLPIK